MTARLFTALDILPSFYEISIYLSGINKVSAKLYIPGGTEDKGDMDGSEFRKIKVCSSGCKAFFERGAYNPVCPICGSKTMLSGIYLATLKYPRYCFYRSLFFSFINYFMKIENKRQIFHEFFRSSLYKKLTTDGTIDLKDGCCHVFGELFYDSNDNSIKMSFLNLPPSVKDSYIFTILKFPKGKYAVIDKHFDLKKAYSCASDFDPEQLYERTDLLLSDLKDVLYKPVLDFLRKLSQVGFYAYVPFPYRETGRMELIKIHCVTIYEDPKKLYQLLGQVGTK